MLKIYNSLTRQIEDFKPLNPPGVGMYTCGPTVYSFAHIGNFRTYTTADLLIRTLMYNGFDVKYIMNLTDVGHLTGDNLGDADTGEDRMEKTAKKEGKTAWEVAEFYTQAFLNDYKALNLLEPELFVKATDHIKEQIELVKKLENKGYTYKISDGIYFDTGKYPEYGQLSSLDQIKEGARVEINVEKKSPRDFALWKFSYPGGISRPASAEDFGEARQMEWDSPWGLGFPGWHIECSAMALKYLGDAFDGKTFYGERSRTIDIHAGGMDIKETHHPNEIAQSECATGKKFVNYWVHGAFILVNGEKMSKSKGNLYRVYDLEKEGYDPMSLRYLYLQTHYRKELNFTFTALDAAAKALTNLREALVEWGLTESVGWNANSLIGVELEKKFIQAINNDLNMPEALSVVWELVKSDLPVSKKAAFLLKMDEILGLGLRQWSEENQKISLSQLPSDVGDLIKEREVYRKNKQYTKADHLRNKIKKLGYDILDTASGSLIKRI